MKTELYTPFITSTKEIINQMTGIEVLVNDALHSEGEEVVSKGVSSIIAYAGKVKGRLLLDVEGELAITMGKTLTGHHYTSAKEFMVLSSVSEVNNIIAGRAITELNNKYSLDLRLSPPIVFTGKDAVISIPKLYSISVNCSTRYGSLKVNIAFERSV